jgi:hypothetical protein
VCAKCGHTQGRFHSVDEPTMTMFIVRLTALVASKDTHVAIYSCRALLSLLSKADANHAARYRKRIRDSHGLPFLLQSISSGNEVLRQEASNLLSELTPDLLHRHSVVGSLDEKSMHAIDSLVTQEIRNLTIKLKADHEVLRRKLAFREMIKDSLAMYGSAEDALRRSSDYSPSKMQILNYFDRSDDENESKSAFGHTLERGMQVLRPRDSANFETVRLNPSFKAPVIPLIPDTYSESSAPLPFIKFFESQSSSNTELLPSDLFKNCVVSGHALWYDQEDCLWKVVFLVLYQSDFRVYSSDSDDPSKPLMSVAIIPETSGVHAACSGRKHCKPHCLMISDGISQGIFCFRSSERADTWKRKISRSSGNSFEASVSATVPVDYLVELLKCLPEHEMLPDSFLDYFGENSIWRYGSVLFRDIESRIWAPVFLIFLNGKELKIYESSTDHPSQAFDCVYVEAGQTEVHQWEEIDRMRFCFSLTGRSIGSGKLCTYEFCLPSTTKREPWIRHFRHSPSFSAKDSQSQLLRLLFNESEKSFTDDQEVKSFRRESGAKKPLAPPTEEDEDNEDVDDKIAGGSIDDNHGFKEDEVSPKFVARFGRCTRHGYLIKRGRVRKNWKKRYFYLVGNELHYFVSHLVSSSILNHFATFIVVC